MNTCAAFTIQKNERDQLPRWWTYYSSQFEPCDLFILDHESDDPATIDTLQAIRAAGGNVDTVHNDVFFDHGWLIETVQNKQQELLERYDFVLFAEADEMVTPATKTLREFVAAADEAAYRCVGYEVQGRDRYCFNDDRFNKTLLSSIPLKWAFGFHSSRPAFPVSEDLWLVHLHRLDYAQAWARNVRNQQMNWNREAVRQRLSIQNQIDDEDEFLRWYGTPTGPTFPIPARVLEMLELFK